MPLLDSPPAFPWPKGEEEDLGVWGGPEDLLGLGARE